MVEHLLDPLSLTNDLQSDDSVILLDEINGEPANKHVPDQFHKNQPNNESPATKRNTKSKIFQEKKYQIHIGRQFQADCPPLIPIAERNLASLPDRALSVWLPNEDIPDSMLQAYLTLTHKKFGYNIEQALAMLYWHKFNMQAAIRDLENFAPFPEEWTREDKIIFEEALLFHGKNFIRIHELLPDKSVGGLIDYYYSWKKKRERQRQRGRPRIKKRQQSIQMRLYD